jgi:hypothetical protein
VSSRELFPDTLDEAEGPGKGGDTLDLLPKEVSFKVLMSHSHTSQFSTVL